MEELNLTETTDNEEHMNDSLSPIAADLIDRLSRIEANVTRMVKVVEGNGVPGLVQRVDDLESVGDKAKGGDSMKAKWMAIATSIVIALLSGIGGLMVQYNNRAIAEREAMNVYLERQDGRIQAVEIEVAVLLQGLKGDHGDKGKTGDQGKTGTKGEKGGIALFGNQKD